MSMFWHCPICWDGEETCRCTAEEMESFIKKIDKEKKLFAEKNKKLCLEYYHRLLDKSVNQSDELGGEPWEWYFLKEVIKNLDRGKWIELKKAVDVYFKVNI